MSAKVKYNPRLLRQQYIKKLDSDFALAAKAEDEMQATFAKYICVRLGGFMETSLKESIQNFVEARKSHSVISSYIKTRLQDITNLNAEKIERVLKSFSDDWCREFKKRSTDEMRMSLGSVYTNRNDIAHGGNNNVSLTNLKNDYANLKSVASLLDDIISK